MSGGPDARSLTHFLGSITRDDHAWESSDRSWQPLEYTRRAESYRSTTQGPLSARGRLAAGPAPEGTSLLLGRRFEQAQRSGHLADGPVRVVGPEDAAVLRLGVAISDPVAEGLTEGGAVSQAATTRGG